MAFELSVANEVDRIYHGPEVVGSSRCWGPGAMTGRGCWPLLGHNFQSWSVHLDEGCQITGGRFSMADEVLVNVVGIAIPETESTDTETESDWPSFQGAADMAALVGEWEGACRQCEPSGQAKPEAPVTRSYVQNADGGFTMSTSIGDVGKDEVCLRPLSDHTISVTGDLIGYGKRYGWTVETEGVDRETGLTTTEKAVLLGQNLVCIRQTFRSAVLEGVAVLRLTRKG